MSKIIIKGKASGKRWNLFADQADLEKSLLVFLQEKNFPIASSCSGKGQCLKCITSDKVLVCKKMVKEVLNTIISFDYL